MPAKRGAAEGVYAVAPPDPRDRVKARLLEPQPAAVLQRTPRPPRPSRGHRHTADSVPPPEGFRPVSGDQRGRSSGRTGHLRRARTSADLRRRDRPWGASPEVTEPP